MGKNQRRVQKQHYDELPSSAYDNPKASDAGSLDEEDEDEQNPAEDLGDNGLRHALYQRAVQAPKGEISYFCKFFLNYIGGRTPLRMREDFCGTALICAEWVRTDARRTAVGVDLDEDALSWGLQNNLSKLKGDATSRVYLFKQNVLHPIVSAAMYSATTTAVPGAPAAAAVTDAEGVKHATNSDVICALNFSCCCLQSRKDLVKYFNQVLKCISSEGGIFLMDLYGGTSSEKSLKIRRRYADFTYNWEQEEFDIIKRSTRISLHFQLNNPKRTLRHAFSYHWRLWTIPEIRDCMDEAGFHSTRVWICEMPDLKDRKDFTDSSSPLDYEEMQSFKQCDAWNAYIIGVKNPSD